MKRQSRTFNGKGGKKKEVVTVQQGEEESEERVKRGERKKINKRTMLRGDENQREREWGVEVLDRKWMTWNVVGVRIMTWRYLEEEKFFLSASSFNRYDLSASCNIFGFILLSIA